MLSAFSISGLQESLAILRLLDAAGVRTIDEAISRVDQAMGGSVLAQSEVEQVRPEDRCPSCGKGSMSLCRVTSSLAGVPVAVCSRHCGYSEVRHG